MEEEHKYYCPDCKSYFDEPEEQEDLSPYRDPWEPTVLMCPNCGNQYFNEV